jgi:alkanesulfonate monooxygenase SsuD/methylene tetrahydromethanopterin reductase-like flavin-dependent oxidoreductase (luciferase family)
MDFSLFYFFDYLPHQNIDVLYDDFFSQVILAEKLNYRGVFVTEHHFKGKPHSIMPNPYVLLAATAKITKKLLLGTGVSILPFHHPVAIAENFALLDRLSKGRGMLGVGSGFLAHEFAGFGLNIENKRQTFDEALMVLRKILDGESLTLSDGPYRGENICLNVSAYQERQAPIYVASLQAESAYHIGCQGHGLFSLPFNTRFAAISAIENSIKNYEAGLKTIGKNLQDLPPIFNFYCHVAKTDKEAIDRMRLPFARYVDSQSASSEQGIHQSFQSFYEPGLLLCGSAQTVAQKLRAMQDLGIPHVMLFKNFGGMAHEVVCDSMRRLAEDVVPLLDK